MIKIVTGIVKKIIEQNTNYQIVEVMIDNKIHVAINFLDMNNPINIDEQVYVNITASELNLGSGGFDYIIPNNEFACNKKGHIMKLRYTPLQFSVLTQEEREPSLFIEPPYFSKMNIVVCELHSMLAPIAIYLKEKLPSVKISVIITDWGMLNVKLSNNIDYLKKNGYIDYVITCGEAFNGDFECINEINSLILSLNIGADVTIICPLPGIVGTGTKFGFSAYNSIHVIDDIGRFEGKTIFPLRVSKNDSRERHNIISHHTLTILSYSFFPVYIPVFKFDDNVFFKDVFSKIDKYHNKHKIVIIDTIDKIDIEKYEKIFVSMNKKYTDNKEFFDECFACAEYLCRTLRSDK